MADYLTAMSYAIWPLCASLFFLIVGFRAFWRAFVVARTPVARAAHVAAGPVALSGQAHATTPFTAPFSAVECVFAQTKVLHFTGGKAKHWAVKGTLNLPEGATFLLRDETGSVTVYPSGCDLSGTPHEYVGNVDEVSPEAEGIVRRFGFEWSDPDVKVTENVIFEGDPVYVLAAGTGPLRVGAPSRGRPFLISTDRPLVLQHPFRRSVQLQLGAAVLFLLVAAACFVPSVLEGMHQRSIAAANAAAAYAVLNVRDATGATPLMRAARKGDLASVRRLIAAGADLNMTDRNGRTALHDAALARSPQIAQALLDGKALVNIGDNVGDTPLHIAANENALAVVRVLVAGGESPNAYNNAHLTPLDIARAKHLRLVVLALAEAPFPADNNLDEPPH
jgi:Ankyrin repeats (many copies)/E3 Ubiquitin ligase/Ankyrin repeat